MFFAVVEPVLTAKPKQPSKSINSETKQTNLETNTNKENKTVEIHHKSAFQSPNVTQQQKPTVVQLTSDQSQQSDQSQKPLPSIPETNNSADEFETDNEEEKKIPVNDFSQKGAFEDVNPEGKETDADIQPNIEEKDKSPPVGSNPGLC